MIECYQNAETIKKTVLENEPHIYRDKYETPKDISKLEIIAKLHGIYNIFKIEYCLPDISIRLSNRLKRLNGHFSGEYLQFEKDMVWNRTCFVPEYKCLGGYGIIVMSLNLLNDSGWERFEQTFKHEMAHAAELVNDYTCGHGNNFVRYCLSFGGSLDRKNLKRKRHNPAYEKCIPVDEGTRTLSKYYKYKYECPGCGISAKYMKKMAKKVRDRRVCRVCRTPLSQFHEILLNGH